MQKSPFFLYLYVFTSATLNDLEPLLNFICKWRHGYSS